MIDQLKSISPVLVGCRLRPSNPRADQECQPRESSSNAADVQKNADGSVDIFFGPQAPAAKESNWIPTDSTRQFELMFRLYAPTKALFEKMWALPDPVREY